MTTDSRYQRRILAGLNMLGKHVYAGTITGDEKAARRKKGKAAKAARKIARSNA